jgi:hypothetical protein
VAGGRDVEARTCALPRDARLPDFPTLASATDSRFRPSIERRVEERCG